MMAKKSILRPHPTGTRQYTDLRMRPFDHSGRDHQYALMLTEATASYTSDANNAALILVIAGIAAIENHEDRQSLAETLIKRVYSLT